MSEQYQEPFTDEKTRRILNEDLDKLGWTGAEVAEREKRDARKICIAQRLRAGTAVTLKWIAAELDMGTWTRDANRVAKRERQNRTRQPT